MKTTFSSSNSFNPLASNQKLLKMNVQCKYQVAPYTDPKKRAYTCTVTSLSITRAGMQIKSFVGAHQPGYSDKDVQDLFIVDQDVKFFPRGLHKLFPNLTNLTILRCGLQDISKADLNGLEKLESFILNAEPKTLPNDLFAGLGSLRWVYYNGDQFECTSSKNLTRVVNRDFKAKLQVILDFINRSGPPSAPVIDQELDKLKAENNELRRQLEQCRNATGNNAKIEAENAELRRQVEQYRKDAGNNANIQAENNELRRQLDLSREATRNNAKIEAENAELRRQLEQYRKDAGNNANIQAENKGLIAQLQKAMEDMRRMQEEIDDLRMQLQKS